MIPPIPIDCFELKLNFGNFRSNAGLILLSGLQKKPNSRSVSSLDLCGRMRIVLGVFRTTVMNAASFVLRSEMVHGSDGVEHYRLTCNTGPCTPFGMSFHPIAKNLPCPSALTRTLG
jgi:hypothetical protein